MNREGSCNICEGQHTTGACTESSQTEPKGLEVQLHTALLSDDVDRIIDILRNINTQLTGQQLAHFQPGPHKHAALKQLIETFLQDAKESTYAQTIIYLGDGGFSRIILEKDPEDGVSIKLSPVSTDEVKAKWENIR